MNGWVWVGGGFLSLLYLRLVFGYKWWWTFDFFARFSFLFQEREGEGDRLVWFGVVVVSRRRDEGAVQQPVIAVFCSLHEYIYHLL